MSQLEHMLKGMAMIDAAMGLPPLKRPDVSAGIEERELCVSADPLAPLRLIAAHQSTDPLLANVEQAVRDALAAHDSTARPEHPLADRFRVDRYRGGEADVFGERVHAGTVDGSGGDMVLISAQTDIGWRDLRVLRAVAIEIRDALDVLIFETRRNTPE